MDVEIAITLEDIQEYIKNCNKHGKYKILQMLVGKSEEPLFKSELLPTTPIRNNGKVTMEWKTTKIKRARFPTEVIKTIDFDFEKFSQEIIDNVHKVSDKDINNLIEEIKPENSFLVFGKSVIDMIEIEEALSTLK
jgi:hypothetical protein